MHRLAALSACVALAACSVAADSTKPASTPAVKLYALDCGHFTFADVDSMADDHSMQGVTRSFIDPCYLVRHPDGDLLWDTGVPESIAALPDGLRVPAEGLHAWLPKTLTAQLAELALTPADIEFVSLSHGHFDHAGNGNLFAASTWIVDADERASMLSDTARGGEDFAQYSALERAKTVLIEGDATHDVFGDGSVVIHQAPGHTPGHAVLLVRTARSGPVLLTGDLWHMAESRERRLVPSYNSDRAQTIASMERVEALARQTGARIVRQHVPEDFSALPTFPTALE